MTNSQLDKLRQAIDAVDQLLLRNLAERMKLVQAIGAYKKQQGLPALQPSRWMNVLTNRLKLAEDIGLSKNFVQEVWETIHEEALRLEEVVAE